MVTFLLTGKPKLKVDRQYKSTQKIKGGSHMKLEVQITEGFPKPNITWYHNDQSVESDSSILIDNTEKSSKLEVLRSDKNASGIYRVVAENAVGSDSLDFTVEVKGEYMVGYLYI